MSVTVREVTHFALGDLADRYGLPVWKIRRVFERGLLSEPSRVGQYRVLSLAELPGFEEALRRAGYLVSPAPVETVRAG